MAPDLAARDVRDNLSTTQDLINFLHSRSVRNGWIALWVLWMVWALLFIGKQVLGGQAARRVGAPRAGETVVTTAGETTATTTEYREKGIIRRSVDSMHARVTRASDLARDLTVFLLIGLTVNSIAHGAGVSVLALAWIFFVLSVLWIGLVLVIDNFVIDAIMGTIQFGIILAILSIAYHYGW
ncbi:hypothetical protein DFQ27_007660 [Actinomortierella ambigua]|uniref:Uncharacterized protein n=1 Tax=Actinomortierella ambigua TaxID=1343610 RepID=A0A9P6PSG1_9FUNG|nr:hypothetical protein DFQ27_007660 [Actinomortierella ambigua]